MNTTRESVRATGRDTRIGSSSGRAEAPPWLVVTIATPSERNETMGFFDLMPAIGTQARTERGTALGAKTAHLAFDLRSRRSMSDSPEPLEIPQLYRYHAFCCFQSRPPGHPKGSCSASGGGPLWERLGNALNSRGLSRTAMTASGCLGFCNAGPLMVVYPEGIWYQPRTTEDIDEIVQSHFVEAKPVERLIVVLER